MDKILLIDAHNALWRACVKFGNNALQDVDDSIVFTFNFFRNLRPLIEDFEPDKCFLVLEGHPQFRYDLFPEYKANRIIKQASKKETSDTFFKMKEIVLSLIQYLPITICRAPNYEADDAIATLVDNMKSEDITIISSDTDFIQLLQKGYPKVKLYNPIKKNFIQAPEYPYVPWKSLAGDKSDNIPALLKPKKAIDTASDPELFKKFMELEENRANFNINLNLIEFRYIPTDEIEIKEGVKDFHTLKIKFSEMKFESIVNDKSWKKFTDTFDCIKY